MFFFIKGAFLFHLISTLYLGHKKRSCIKLIKHIYWFRSHNLTMNTIGANPKPPLVINWNNHSLWFKKYKIHTATTHFAESKGSVLLGLWRKIDEKVKVWESLDLSLKWYPICLHLINLTIHSKMCVNLTHFLNMLFCILILHTPFIKHTTHFFQKCVNLKSV